MQYVDGYVLPVPKKNLPAYRRMAEKAGKIWREHGALEYRECAGDDLKVKSGFRSLEKPRQSPARRWYSPRSYSSRAPTAIESTLR